MKTVYVLLVNYDGGALDTYAPLFERYGITPHNAGNMTKALSMLLEDEYSGIAINADDFEYLLLMKVMRTLTTIPIVIGISRYNKAEHDAAIDAGADMFRVRHNDPEHRIRGFSNAVLIYLEFTKWLNTEQTTITYKNIHILPDSREVLSQGKKAELSGMEFDILYCLVKNSGRILTYGQIYSNVWGRDYADASRTILFFR